MSYSFNVRGATVALAVAAVASKFDETVTSQPVHAADKEAAVAAATAVASLISEPAEGQEVSISVNGWLQWQTQSQEALKAGELPTEFTGCSLGVQVSLVAKTE